MISIKKRIKKEPSFNWIAIPKGLMMLIFVYALWTFQMNADEEVWTSYTVCNKDIPKLEGFTFFYDLSNKPDSFQIADQDIKVFDKDGYTLQSTMQDNRLWFKAGTEQQPFIISNEMYQFKIWMTGCYILKEQGSKV